MKKKKILIVPITLLIIGVLFSYRIYQDESKKAALSNFAPPPATVSATTAKTADWQAYISSIGSLEATQGIDVVPQVSGVVDKINFKSGQMIQKGDPIISLDTSVLKAQLASAQANMNLKRVTYDRYNTLYKQKAVSHDLFDKAKSDYNQAVAVANEMKAQLKQMTVYAPFSGRLGLRDVSIGQYISAGTVITNLQTVTPILLNCDVTSQDITKLYVGQPISITTDSFPDKTFDGKITAMDARVDADTRSLTVRGQLPNPDDLLYPGMFVQTKIFLKEKAQVVVIPQEAVTYTLYGNSVFLVNKQKDSEGKTKLVAKQQTVTVGERRGDLVSITKGLEANQLVVTTGQIKLQNGTSVKIADTKGQS